MTRPWRVAAIVGALAAVQLIAVLGYRWIERGRARPRAFAVAALAGSPAPSFAIERADWTVVEVGGAGRVRLVHFWATWCPPCRDELPALLARAAATPELELIAVSVDDDWTAIRRFFPEGVPAVVVRARDRDAHRRYGARTLPDSYVVDGAGRLVERLDGARDWTRAEAASYLRDLPRRWAR